MLKTPRQAVQLLHKHPRQRPARLMVQRQASSANGPEQTRTLAGAGREGRVREGRLEIGTRVGNGDLGIGERSKGGEMEGRLVSEGRIIEGHGE